MYSLLCFYAILVQHIKRTNRPGDKVKLRVKEMPLVLQVFGTTTWYNSKKTT